MSDPGGYVALSDDRQWLLVAGTRWPVAECTVEDHALPGSDYVMRMRRALVMVEAGYSVSVIWGGATYSSNYNTAVFPDDAQPFTEYPTHVEVVVMGRQGEWLTAEPLGYVPAADLAQLLTHLAQGAPPDP